MTSAADAAGLPADDIAQIALAGRSNVGKSSLINALVGQRVARTSQAPGKTRLANVYRIALTSAAVDTPKAIYLVDLPGYGYARGGAKAAEEFARLTEAYLGRVNQAGQVGRVGRVGQMGRVGNIGDSPIQPTRPIQRTRLIGVVLAIDSRHPGLANDRAAFEWLASTHRPIVVVATKIDQLPRTGRERSLRELESLVNMPVLPVSAVTGEGLKDLWKLLIRLPTNDPPAPAPPPPR